MTLAMFDSDMDFPYALMLDTLTSYMAKASGEEPEQVRARIERVLREQITKRERDERRMLLRANGAGL